MELWGANPDQLEYPSFVDIPPRLLEKGVAPMGLFDNLKERMISGEIYSLYGIQERRNPHASERELLELTLRKRLDEFREGQPKMAAIPEELIEERITHAMQSIHDKQELVSFILGFEKSMKEHLRKQGAKEEANPLIPNASQPGRMHGVLAMNLGRPAWKSGRVLLLRSRSDTVLDQISEAAVILRRSRDGVVLQIELQELSAVVLRDGMPGAEFGEAVSTPGDTVSDLRIVSDRPFIEVWPEISAEGQYLWRSASTEELNRQIIVLGARMEFSEDEQGVEAARNLAAIAERIMEHEPGVEDPSFFYMYGNALAKLKKLEATIQPYEKFLQCAPRRGGVEQKLERLIHRRLGLALSIKGAEDDDRALKSRALRLLDAAELDADDTGAIRVREMLRSQLAS